MSKKVSILGAGNGGMALSFHLSSLGTEVLLWADKDHASAIDGINQLGGIEAIETKTINGKVCKASMSGFTKIAKTTTDMKEAIEYSDVIVMLVPAYAQEEIFAKAMPHLRDGQIIVLLPGNFGSLVLSNMMKEAGINKDVIIVEGMSIPHACRRAEAGKVYISSVKRAMDVAAFPGNRTYEAIDRLQDVLPLMLLAKKNVLEVAFSNVNMVVHPGTATLNMGLIESRDGNFFFYKEGMSNAVGKVLDKIDEERLAIGEKLNLNLKTFTEIGEIIYNIHSESVHDFAIKSPGHNTLAPKSCKDRYIVEDTPYLLVPVSEFGKLAGVTCNAINSIINIDNIYNDADYYQEGRNLSKLGFTNKTAEEIIGFVNTGSYRELSLALCA